MQRPSHPVYGPNTLFDPTRWLQRRLDQLGITLPEVLAMLPSATTQTADEPNKLWHIGDVAGRSRSWWTTEPPHTLGLSPSTNWPEKEAHYGF